jgi:hypothetical protein
MCKDRCSARRSPITSRSTTSSRSNNIQRRGRRNSRRPTSLDPLLSVNCVADYRRRTSPQEN